MTAYELNQKMWEAIFNPMFAAVQKVQGPITVPCPDCDQRVVTNGYSLQACERCQGTGRIRK